jgi:polar amino acid transport system substrate-binding protein
MVHRAASPWIWSSSASGRLNVPIRITFLPMTRAQTMMASGAADGVFPLAYKEERLSYVSYPREKLVEDSISFFVRQDSEIRYDGDIAKLAQYTFGRAPCTGRISPRLC